MPAVKLRKMVLFWRSRPGCMVPWRHAIMFFKFSYLHPQICQPDRVLLSGKTIWITFEINHARLVIIRKLNKIRPFWNGINSFKIHSFAFFVTPRRDYCKRLWTESKPEEKSLEIPDFSCISGRVCQLITTFIRFVIPYSVINFVCRELQFCYLGRMLILYIFLIQRIWTVTKLTELNL